MQQRIRSCPGIRTPFKGYVSALSYCLNAYSPPNRFTYTPTYFFSKSTNRIICLVNKLLSELTQKDPITFEQQHLSNCVWAYSKLDIPAPTLFSKVAKEVEHRDKSGKEVFSPQSLTNLVWSFAMAKAPDCDSLFKAVASQIIRRNNLKRFKPQELSNISWSYANATAAVSPPDRGSLFKKIAAELAGRHDWRPFSSHHMATIAWSFATVNHRAPMVFNPAFNNALHIKIEEFSPMELSQLYQWHLWQTVEEHEHVRG